MACCEAASPHGRGSHGNESHHLPASLPLALGQGEPEMAAGSCADIDAGYGGIFTYLKLGASTTAPDGPYSVSSAPVLREKVVKNGTAVFQGGLLQLGGQSHNLLL